MGALIQLVLYFELMHTQALINLADWVLLHRNVVDGCLRGGECLSGTLS